MSERFAVSPFGGKGLVRAQFIVNEQVIRARREGGAGAKLTAVNAPPHGRGAPDKWKLIRAVTEARAALKLSDRTIVVLEALVSFCPERTLDPGRPIIVFPSNTELSLRSRGMAPATLRRHLAALVEAGLVLRRDSANGKRYACRDGEGRIESAFGFDLSPLAVRAAEIEAMAAETRRQAAALRALRSEVTIHLRDIAALLRAAREEGRGCAFAALEERLEALSGRLGRNTDLPTLQARRDRLVQLRAEVEAAWLEGASEPAPEPELTAVNALSAAGRQDTSNREVSANDAQNERQIKSSDSEDSNRNIVEFSESPDRSHSAFPAKVDSCQLLSPGSPGPRGPKTHRAGVIVPEAEACGARVGENPFRNVDARQSTSTEPGPSRNGASAKTDPAQGSIPPAAPQVELTSVLTACPQIRDYLPGGIRSWRDLAKAADLVRTMLGVTGELWLQARCAMGEMNAAVVIAAMLERADELKSPGAYLRSLAKRAEIGGFSPRPMLDALLAARLRDRSGTHQPSPVLMVSER